jgi:hypothetical protein
MLQPAPEDWCRDYLRLAVQHPLEHERQAHPTDVDLAYVADRCLTDEAARDRAFAAGSAAHRQHQ